MVKQLLRDGDVVSGAVLAALGAYIVLQASNWSYYGAGTPGPGFFPIWYGIAMIVLSLGMIANRIVKREVSEVGAIDWRGAGRALGAWLAMVGAVLLLRPLGFMISFALLTLFIVTVILQRSLMTAALVAVVATIAFHAIFAVILDVALPVGFLGF